jgi:hypothetical protein
LIVTNSLSISTTILWKVRELPLKFGESLLFHII